MKSENSDRVERLISRWWLSLIVGVVLLAVGFVVMVNPVDSYFSFAMWFGFAVLLSGVAGLMQGLSSDNLFVRRSWLILASVADIIIGVVLIFNMLLSAYIMPILLGAWLLYRGAAMLMQGFDLVSHKIGGGGWVIFYSTIVIAISIAVLWLPETLGVEAVVLFVAIAFIAYGISMMSFGFRLWDIHRHAKALCAED
jgi:uncharacterized membrane protein HdeD (DUF308 family)